MPHIDLVALTHHAAPVATVLLPLNQHEPGNLEDPRRLEAAVDVATAQLAVRGATDAIANLRSAATRVDFAHPAQSVAILADPEQALVVPLAVPVPERVSVSEHFALGELVAAQQRLPNARVVLLARNGTRMIEVVDGVWDECVGDGFPVVVDPPRQADTPHRDLPIGEREDDEIERAVFRAVEDAVARACTRSLCPVVLVGNSHNVAVFEEVARHSIPIVARIEREHAHATVPQVAELVGPALERFGRTQVDGMAAAVLDSIGSRAVGGIDAVRSAAQAGRGSALVIERGIDDADALIETVVTHGGSVVVTEPGALADCGGVALALRY